jgi:hypothetical protein
MRTIIILAGTTFRGRKLDDNSPLDVPDGLAEEMVAQGLARWPEVEWPLGDPVGALPDGTVNIVPAEEFEAHLAETRAMRAEEGRGAPPGERPEEGDDDAADAAEIAGAFRQICSAAMKINEVLSRNDALDQAVPEAWPLPSSANEFAAACAAMAEHYGELARGT